MVNIKEVFLECFINFLKSSAAQKETVINSEKQQLTEELHKPIVRKCEKRKAIYKEVSLILQVCN